MTKTAMDWQAVADALDGFVLPGERFPLRECFTREQVEALARFAVAETMKQLSAELGKLL